ncbi:MAG: hypothetical protein NC332_01535 [Firmicutes bacterium]|nr:hypothetical protein [Bacillota bacterium]
MNFIDLIGLEVCEAEGKLVESGITNFKFVYYVDRKQSEFDKEIVTAVRQKDDALELIVCRYLFAVK